MNSATALPRAKKLGADVDVKLRQTSRVSKWNSLMEQVKELDDGEKLAIDVPKGSDPELFRNTVSNAVYIHVRKPQLYPGYKFPVKLTSDLKQVIVVCEFDEAKMPKKPTKAKPKAPRRRKGK